MKAALKRKWIAALRSGDYKQGKGALYAESAGGVQHCCLGVLRHCATGRNRYYDDGGLLAPSFLKLAGLPDATQRQLANNMNDMGWSFKRIATWIEKNL